MQQHDADLGSGHSAQPDIHVVQARVQMLFEALREVKSLLKSIEDSVGLIRVFDMQIKQQGQDFSRLEQDVRDHKKYLEEVEDRLEQQISEAIRVAKDEAEKTKEVANNTRNALENKVSYVQGAVAAVAVLGAVMYAAGGWWVSRYTSMTDGHARFIHTMETLNAEDHLRDAMVKPPNRFDLGTKPEVVSPGVNSSGAKDKEDVPRL